MASYPLSRHHYVAVGGKRLHEFGGDITNSAWSKCGHRFLSRLPSPKPNRVMRTTRTFSALVGKVDIRKLEHYAQNDPDAYGYSGAVPRQPGDYGVRRDV
jgi:serine protein kinase